MANIFSIISIAAFVLSGLFLLMAIILFFALDARSAYWELKGQPQKKQLLRNGDKKKNKKTQSVRIDEKETKTVKMDVEDEAVTTLDNGEEVTENALMNVYEPGTELFTEEMIDSLTEVQTNQTLREEFWDEECETSVETFVSKSEFKITKRIVYVHCNEILK